MQKNAENSTETVVGKPFAPGVSGNPGGRPRSTWNNPHDLVFTNLIGNPLNSSNFSSRDFPAQLNRAQVKKIRFHDLRHSTASLLLSLDVHPKIVQELLGHSNISVTMDIYSHSIPSLQEGAVAKLDALLSG